ncbi:hypothetical protein D1610_09935 [Sphingomonas gilva]|uniref:Uncharacterized protein n=1 Tax=Sphingomonas gilva TaxID=2305907 RepID=A0A396RMR5_9SPHN|nr:hypothetical protein [Sphingomonas gilva]RHW17737.1 hypothetical protein D1610_09935 [Sphingomonas gilva]
MILAGRPLRFMAMLLGGWVTFRVLLLWPYASEVTAGAIRSPGAPPVTARAVIALAQPEAARVSIALPPRSHRVTIRIPEAAPHDARALAASVDTSAGSPIASLFADLPDPGRAETPTQQSPIGRVPGPTGSRWTVSAWLVARGEGSTALAPGGTLGGSQAGLRASWRPIRSAPAALFWRMSRPLRTRGAEAALGVEVQPFARIPVRAALEQRFALEDGAAEGTALSLVGGVGDVPLAAGFRLDAYGQAGIIGLHRRIGFADGAASVMRPVAAWREVDLALGAGVWGAAQPGLSRLDVGPRAELRLPIARRRVRLGIEWRQRVAGNARPDSGPALTLGTDF